MKSDEKKSFSSAKNEKLKFLISVTLGAFSATILLQTIIETVIPYFAKGDLVVITRSRLLVGVIGFLLWLGMMLYSYKIDSKFSNLLEVGIYTFLITLGCVSMIICFLYFWN